MKEKELFKITITNGKGFEGKITISGNDANRKIQNTFRGRLKIFHSRKEEIV